MFKSVFVFIILSLFLSASLYSGESEIKGKYAIVLQAGTESHEGLARALHALLYSKELMESGYKVALIFDGAGTTWIPEITKKEHKLNAMYTLLADKGIVEEICDYCAGAFKVKDKFNDDKMKNLDSTYSGHPSLVKWIGKGYEIIVL